MPAGEVLVVSNSISNARETSNAALTYRIEYPQFLSRASSPSLQRISAHYQQQARYLARGIQASDARAAAEDQRRRLAQGEAFSPHEVLRTFSVTYGQNCVLSLYLDDYRYTGGAHGETRRASDTWDARTGRRVPLSALFAPGADFADRLQSAVEAEIARRGAAPDAPYFEDAAERARARFDPESFYLTPDALVIYYQQYDLAPYAAGIPTFPIPYAAVGARIPGC